MTARVKLVAGNWKMNGVSAALAEVNAMIEGSKSLGSGVELAVCPPATLAPQTGWTLRDSAIALGGQDCHPEKSGAFTGDVSAEMWADIGAKYVIVGHSERRAMHGETDVIVAAKASAAIRASVTPIICLGESLAERDAGKTIDVVSRQLAGSVPDAAAGKAFVIAYEPIWAIGTGRTPTAAQVAEVHAALRAGLVKRFGEAGNGVRLLYGGSVKPDNARELMHVPDVDGALVGGASLKSVDFLAIARACV
ncbi:MAG TPA: triose-phosphate isomerase [Hyphomonadaceae bacterium]|jgi:triosephosphate isomerase|nr:triose-phosphate isomerase [Hyphomonadaceae bacterium]